MSMFCWDFRRKRCKLKSNDFAISEGPEASPTDLIDKETWRSMTALPDDVSLRTSDHYGTILRTSWGFWSEWIALVGALQEVAVDSPIAEGALDSADHLQASVFSALCGYYRLSFTSLRAVVEKMTAALSLELGRAPLTFAEYSAGREFGFGPAADTLLKHAHVANLEAHLQTIAADDLFRPRRQKDDGGLARRLFGRLSKFAHAGPLHTDSSMWQSNGPIFVAQTFEEWAQCFYLVLSIGVLFSRLAQPKLGALAYDSRLDARTLFTRTVNELRAGSDGEKLLRRVPPSVW
jgi:hypothetical protein